MSCSRVQRRKRKSISNRSIRSNRAVGLTRLPSSRTSSEIFNDTTRNRPRRQLSEVEKISELIDTFGDCVKGQQNSNPDRVGKVSQPRRVGPISIYKRPVVCSSDSSLLGVDSVNHILAADTTFSSSHSQRRSLSSRADPSPIALHSSPPPFHPPEIYPESLETVLNHPRRGNYPNQTRPRVLSEPVMASQNIKSIPNDQLSTPDTDTETDSLDRRQRKPSKDFLGVLILRENDDQSC